MPLEPLGVEANPGFCAARFLAASGRPVSVGSSNPEFAYVLREGRNFSTRANELSTRIYRIGLTLLPPFVCARNESPGT